MGYGDGSIFKIIEKIENIDLTGKDFLQTPFDYDEALSDVKTDKFEEAKSISNSDDDSVELGMLYKRIIDKDEETKAIENEIERKKQEEAFNEIKNSKVLLINKIENKNSFNFPMTISKISLEQTDSRIINTGEEKKSDVSKPVLNSIVDDPSDDSLYFLREEDKSEVQSKENLVTELEKKYKIDTTTITIKKQLNEQQSNSRVYLAVMGKSNANVVVKQFLIEIGDASLEKLVEKLSKEVELVSTFNHRNIIKYMKFHRSNLKELKNMLEYNIIMEYMENGSLFDMLKMEQRGLTMPLLKNILKQVLSGLQYLHSKNIIHRDIKPQNILVNRNKTIYKITDFGICTKVEEKYFNIKRSCAGTPWYMAPEIILGEPYSFSADIWSLGCLAFELFCGKKPYSEKDGLTTMSLMANNTNPLQACPDSLKHKVEAQKNGKFSDFLKKCWNRNPKQRPSASELLKHGLFKEEIKEIKPKQIQSQQKIPQLSTRNIQQKPKPEAKKINTARNNQRINPESKASKNHPAKKITQARIRKH